MPVVARQRMVARIARQAGEVEPGLLRHLAHHVEIDVDLAAGKILRVERAGGEIDAARIGRARAHADGDQRAVAGDRHGVREGVLGTRPRPCLAPVQERREADRMAGAFERSVAIGEPRQQRRPRRRTAPGWRPSRARQLASIAARLARLERMRRGSSVTSTRSTGRMTPRGMSKSIDGFRRCRA